MSTTISGSRPFMIPSSAAACATVRGKPSRMNPPAHIGFRQPLPDDADHHVVADQLAAVHDRLRPQSDLACPP